MPSSLPIAFLDDQTLPTCYSVTSVVFECCQNGHRQIKFCVVIRGWPNGVGDDVRVEGGRWTKGDGRRKRLTGLFSLKAPLSLSLSLALSQRKNLFHSPRRRSCRSACRGRRHRRRWFPFNFAQSAFEIADSASQLMMTETTMTTK